MEMFLVIAAIAALFWLMRRSEDRARSDKPSFWQTTTQSTEREPKPLVEVLPESFVVYDLETTGLNPAKHEIIEIGAIRVHRETDLHDTFTTLVMPKGRISSRITEITGINRAMIKKDGISPDKALAAFRDFVGDLPMVAFNAPFDRKMLEAACDRHGHARFTNKHDCALALSRRVWPGRKSYRLSAICADAGISLHSEHRALADCERALRVYVAARQLGDRPQSQ
ncbi:3'-5' exonuclease [Sphingomicrobium sp. XHP0235]|uniref:3'-5' exonuclease n=1 Tax=Sphingomicrobium aquimarinum TaxID=3133971 RepID=UPI0031FE54B5